MTAISQRSRWGLALQMKMRLEVVNHASLMDQSADASIDAVTLALKKVYVELSIGGMNGINSIRFVRNDDGSMVIDIEGWSSGNEPWAGSAQVSQEDADRIAALFDE